MNSKAKLLFFLMNIFGFIAQAQYIEGFSGSSPLWKYYTVNSGSGFEIKAPPTSLGQGAHSGSSCLVIGSDSGYQPNSYAIAESIILDFHLVSANDSISFWQLYDDENNWDGVTFQYSFDVGLTWITMGFENDSDGMNWFNDKSLISGDPQFSGTTSQSWKFSKHNLTPAFVNTFLPVMFRFVFISDASGNFKAHCIDDVYFPYNIGCWAYDSIRSLLTLYNSNNYCSAPNNIPIGICAIADTLNCSQGDTVNIHVFFGDGTDTLMIKRLNEPIKDGFKFDTLIYHNYSSPGNFSVYFTSTLNNGVGNTSLADTIKIDTTCNSISGKIFFDLNSNCSYDTTDIESNGNTLDFVNNGISQTILSSGSDYSFGRNTILQPSSLSLVNVSPPVVSAMNCPLNATYPLTNLTSPPFDFAINCVSGFDLKAISKCDINLSMNNIISVILRNQLCDSTTGSLKLILPNGISFDTNFINAVSMISADTVIWNYSNLSAVNSNALTPFAKIGVNVDSSLVHYGDTILFKLIAEPIVGDSNPADNTYFDSVIVRSSFDPNDKIVFPPDTILPGVPLTFTINFQNTGNASAVNINVLDSLSDNLNMSSFELLAASHPMSYYINNKKIKFRFENIMLPDSFSNELESHGFIKYKINALNNLNSGEQIYNKAFIYFDSNEAVITNEVLNTISIPTGINDLSYNMQNCIYPSPASDHINLTCNFNFTNYEFRDCLGRCFGNGKLNAETYINTEQLPNGIYFLKLENSKIRSVQKVVIQHE